ncbi:bcl-2-interacting killer isoform X2 [Erinaceus europaeus]|nr:bcl-2-interacting killer isoform X2 [Erinaceus europaeus]
MPQARPVSRGLFLDTFLYEHIPEAVDIPGMTVMAYSEPESSPDRDSHNRFNDVAMRLAFIGDEMELRWTMLHLGQLPGMTVHSLAFTYSQTGVRGVLRSFVESLANLRENIRFWSFLVFRNRMAPSLERDMILSLVLLLVLWGLHLL